MKMYFLVLLILTSLTANAARNWQPVEIPEAYCADGSPYKVFIDRKESNKLGVKFQGGRACWSYFTCYFLELTPRRAPDRIGETQAFMSDRAEESPVSDYSFVFFPYCTGDVHLGSHVASYDGTDFGHIGKHNVTTSVQYLIDQNIVDFSQVEDFVMYGASAGALGALYHITTFAPHLSYAVNKRLVLDAPGLHFGPEFWGTFTDALLTDYAQAIGELGYAIEPNNGVIAGVVRNLCDAYPDWQVGVLQSTRDTVMSVMFGKISAAEHEEAIFSEKGIYSYTENPTDNCSSFLPNSKKHVLLQSQEGARISAGGVSAMDYARSLIESGASQNYFNR